jgi:putative peptide zinc metalloprotease protein
MVFAGVSTIIFNYNPLIKLDGYYLLTDILEVINLRENATAYVVYQVKSRIFRVAAEPPSNLTPRKKRIYLIYGILSTMYILFIVTLFILFVFRYFNRTFPEIGIFLGLYASYLILRKRLRKLMAFSRFVFLDKREVLRQKASVRRAAYAGGALLLLLLFYPFSHTVTAPVTLEPARQLPLRAETEGFVSEVPSDPNAAVSAGAAVVRLRNDEVVARREKAAAELRRRTTEADGALASGNTEAYEAALREQKRAKAEFAELDRRVAKLTVRAPFDGRILTSRLPDLLGKHVGPGDLLCDFGDVRTMRARVRVSEFDFRELTEQQKVRLQVNSFPASIFAGRVAARSLAAPDTYDAASRTLGLVRTVQAAGAQGEGTPFSHFDVLVEVPNTGGLRPGMAGTAKITLDRHCLAVRIFRAVRDLVRSKIWW